MIKKFKIPANKTHIEEVEARSFELMHRVLGYKVASSGHLTFQNAGMNERSQSLTSVYINNTELLISNGKQSKTFYFNEII